MSSFFDFSNGDFCHSISDNMAINSDGDMMMKISDNMAMDMNDGDIHFTSSWNNDEDDYW